MSAAVVGVFVRLSCFGKGNTKAVKKGKEQKSASKKSNKEKEEVVVRGMSDDIYEAICLVEGIDSSSSSSSEFEVAVEVAQLAGSKLMAILADIGNVSMTQLDAPPSIATVTNTDNGKDNKKNKEEKNDSKVGGVHVTTLLDVALATADHLGNIGGLTLLRLEEEEEEAAETLSNVMAALKILSPSAFLSLSFPTLTAAESTESKEEDIGDSSSNSSSRRRLRDSMYSLLSQAAFHTLTSSTVSVQALQDIADVSMRIVDEVNSGKSDSVKEEDKKTEKKIEKKREDAKGERSDKDDEEDDDEEEEEDRPQVVLFDASMELLSVTGDHAVKGVREAIKKVWIALCQVG